MSQKFVSRIFSATSTSSLRVWGAAAVVAALMLAPSIGMTSASAQTLGYAPIQQNAFPSDDVMANPSADEDADSAVLPERFRRQVVSYDTREAPGTVIIDTANTHLYFVLGQNRAIRYGIGVGREGFTWAGTQTVTRKAEWPDWHPPAEMIARQPYLPRFMAGGSGNPLGARAMYLGSTEYRIHGTNDPSTIGKFVSSGCIRLTNEDVSDLFSHVDVGTKVIVLPKTGAVEAHRIEGRAAPEVRTVTTMQLRPAVNRTAVNRANGNQAMNASTSSIY